jgi:N-acetylglucosamine-6-phosphate deacetylase
MVTIAPELKGALNAIREIVDAGAVAAIGHTDATYETVIEALHAGASVATHLFNAMRGFHHRQPGPALALLEDPRVRLELIADGKHLHPAVLASAIKTAGAHRILLVTDAMAAAGATDGDYSLGSSRVHVKSGVARAAVSGVIAGSTLTMDAAFRNVLATSGVPLSDVVLTACSNPADTLALSGVGRLRAGGHADLVVLDSRLRPTRVMRAGGWVDLSLGADPQLRERA